MIFLYSSWWDPKRRYSCPPRRIGWPRRWRWFLPIHSIPRPIVRQGIIWYQTKLNSLQKGNSEIKINQNYQISKMSFRKVWLTFLFNLADFQKNWSLKNWRSFKKCVKQKIAQNHYNMDIYEATKDLDLELDRHLQWKIKFQLLCMYSSHFTQYYLALIFNTILCSKIQDQYQMKM